MTLTPNDITFELNGNIYKVPFVMMADHPVILQQLKELGHDLSMYEWKGRKLRMKDVLTKLSFSNIIQLFSLKGCNTVLISCFYKKAASDKALNELFLNPEQPLNLSFAWNM